MNSTGSNVPAIFFSIGKSLNNWIFPNKLSKGNPTGLHSHTVHSSSKTEEGQCTLCRFQASSYDLCCSKNMACLIKRLQKP